VVGHPSRIDRPREESMHRKRPHQLRLGFEKERIPDHLPLPALEAVRTLLAKLLVDVVRSERGTGEESENG